MIPGHTGEHHAHAAGIGDTGESEARPDEAGKDEPEGMDEGPEEDACYDEQSGGNPGLALDGNGLLALHYREPVGFPCVGAALHVDQIVESFSAELPAGSDGAVAALADDENFLFLTDQLLHCFGGDLVQWQVDGAFGVQGPEFGGRSDIEKDRVLFGELALDIFGG